MSTHTRRANGITAYLERGGTPEPAPPLANHTSPRTTTGARIKSRWIR
jgi:hypothetical protein